MLKFMHIAPTKYIGSGLIPRSNQLVLAHLLENDKYKTKMKPVDRWKSVSGPTLTILDNSAFELFSQNKPMFNGDKLIELADEITADYIVLPDYPGANCLETINAAIKFAPMFKNAGFGTFFVPQCYYGEIEQYIAAFSWAATSPLIDYIGISILGVPIAYNFDDNDRGLKYISRLSMMKELKVRGLLKAAKENEKKIHFLGMSDGPKEIELMSSFTIDSWDSSSAVWSAINGQRFDNSITGLKNGKVKIPVDFNIDYDKQFDDDIKFNVNYIEQLKGK